MKKELRQNVLYEVMRKKYGKVSADKKLELPDWAKSPQSLVAEDESEVSSLQTQDSTEQDRQTQNPHVRRSGLFITLPVACLLVLIFFGTLFAAFWLGTVYDSTIKTLSPLRTAKEDIYTDSTALPPLAPAEQTPGPREASLSQGDIPQKQLPLQTAGNNVVVIATYKQGDDLVPVKEFFDKNNIETQIQERNGYFFLVTTKKFQNPNRENSDGHSALQKIKKVGAKYKAPTGYETFAPNYFQDAYPMKIRLEGEVLDVY
ncbi:MAG: hypothetical protein ACYTFK_03780 [Planctomycetota bacterium]|jgi:hypothetical protein